MVCLQVRAEVRRPHEQSSLMFGWVQSLLSLRRRRLGRQMRSYFAYLLTYSISNFFPTINLMFSSSGTGTSADRTVELPTSSLSSPTSHYITLHYITFKLKKCRSTSDTLQTLEPNNSKAMGTTPRINVILVWFWRFAGMRSLRLANCSIFVPRRRATLGRRQ